MRFANLTKQFSRKNLPESEVEFVGEVPAETLTPYRQRALSEISAELELPGFRKGKVPTDMVGKHVGELSVLEEAVNLFARDFYPELVEIQKIDVVGRPQVTITKLAPGNPVGLTIRTAVYPQVKPAGDWKKIGENIPLEPYIGELPKMKVPPSPEEEQKAREYLARDKRRGAIIEHLLEKTKVEVPRVFVESELEKIMGQLKDDVKRFGTTFEGYLKQIGKTEEQLRADFRAQAEKRAKLQLVLNKIAEVEGIEADKEAVEKEMKHALQHFPSANPELLQIHVTTVLRNEKVLKLLEGN